MRPEERSRRLLSITRSKAKMYEYGVPEKDHIEIRRDPALLFTLSIGLLGDLAAHVNSDDINEVVLDDLRKNLLFTAHFFDAYLQSEFNNDLRPYLLLLGSASYYLCDLPGSSAVLAKSIGQDRLDLGDKGLGDLLLWVLQIFNSHNQARSPLPISDGTSGGLISEISRQLNQFYVNGGETNELYKNLDSLRSTVYTNGTPRQLLFADVICALARKRVQNSTWFCMPSYTGQSIDDWRPILQKDTFVRELWPAQHLLGEQGIFKGKSAVVQMPTSAGKTKATEIIIRSAFLSRRAFLVVIVTPFRALCHEIKDDLISAFHNESVQIDEFSDVLQVDYQIDINPENKQIWVVTPEKLLYVLRHSPDLAQSIGLLVYDEGHQFDNGVRGVTYELLLTSLKAMVRREIQTVLISAVISNAKEINAWIHGDNSEVVSGTNLVTTYRSVAFASWLDRLGRLEFVTPDDPSTDEFFVPRIIVPHQLERRGREKKDRIFPEKGNSQTIALYLGVKLVANGSVAIFCGTKSTAIKCSERLVDAYNRGLPSPKPVEFSDEREVQRLEYLHERNLGVDATSTQSASLGVFAHHGNTPHGIRLAIEHALKEGFIRYVICTSTLAQGVNLPIRYLIVTNIYQGQERIKVRDFHNLIGRAGRSGMHTEGSILFADTKLYDNKDTENWRWQLVMELLLAENSEPCVSMLLSLFEPLRSDDQKYYIPVDNPLEFVQDYIEGGINAIASISDRIATQYADKKFTQVGLKKQITWKINVISAIESFLMAHWEDPHIGEQGGSVAELATGTLAYSLASEEQRTLLVECFEILARNIEQHVPQIDRRRIFGRTLYGVRDSLAIENWVQQNIGALETCNSHEELLTVLWNLLEKYIQHTVFERCEPADVLEQVATGWIQGQSFYVLYRIVNGANAKIGRLNFKIDNVVDLCENALAYQGTLVLGAVIEIIGFTHSPNEGLLIRNLQQLQKRLKYGLDSPSAISLYEKGFADRAISTELSSILSPTPLGRMDLLDAIRIREPEFREVLDRYPSYYIEKLDDLLHQPSV